MTQPNDPFCWPEPSMPAPRLCAAPQSGDDLLVSHCPGSPRRAASLDDNLAYANCTLWHQHGHPRAVYDCLIELHEVNWERQQLLPSKCLHFVQASHNTRAMIQPVLCDFDAVLYGKGYSFGSLENYRDLDAQP